jgi:hypothetical protein
MEPTRTAIDECARTLGQIQSYRHWYSHPSVRLRTLHEAGLAVDFDEAWVQREAIERLGYLYGILGHHANQFAESTALGKLILAVKQSQPEAGKPIDRGVSDPVIDEALEYLKGLTQQPGPSALRPLVQLRGVAQKPIVLGKEVESLTEARYRVVEALVNAGADGLSKAVLIEKSGKGDAVKYLRELAEQPEWAGSIVMPGRAWGRYSIKHG